MPKYTITRIYNGDAIVCQRAALMPLVDSTVSMIVFGQTIRELMYRIHPEAKYIPTDPLYAQAFVAYDQEGTRPLPNTETDKITVY